MKPRAARLLVPASLALGAWLATGVAAQTSAPALRPMGRVAIEPVLSRPVGEPARAPRTSSDIDLRGKRSYIAEYLLLFDMAGELPAMPVDGRLLGAPVGEGPVRLAYRAEHDIPALQALTDRAYDDLLARLKAAGVVLADAEATVREHGAVYAATELGSRPAAPVVMEFRQGSTTRRYLAFAPSGLRLVPRSAAGIGPGNLAARVAYPLQKIEGLSLAMAFHFSALDTNTPRPSSYALASGMPAVSPLMELAPAPSAALVHAHAQLALVNLGEALVPAAEFGRLRLAPMDGPIPSNDPLKPLVSLGRRLLGDESAQNRQVDALLELDGPATARLVAFLGSAGNQAIADALKAAQQGPR